MPREGPVRNLGIMSKKSADLLRRIAEIDATIADLIEDGVPASSPRVRALRAKKAVLENQDTASSKAIPVTGPTSRERHKNAGPGRIRPVAPVADLLAEKATIPQESKAARRKHRRAIEDALWVVNALRRIGLPRSITEADVMLKEIQSEIAEHADGKEPYPQKLRTTHSNRRRAVREVRKALKWRRRSAPVEPADLAEVLYAWTLREVNRRRGMPADAVGVVGMIQVRSGGAPSLGKRN